ncbi:MAG: monofunctional biosynthetic peptidoglycan transglycosylase [Dysgonamonadaceae bacterium]|jgi:monofunctional biosynthetic peptidoglycan transglycosylase|nr:monofunctional biosynthetic peptidoglycan transglycosylase [Dysgonamonadaceae bacterium]MDD4246741.1 monofunctional biosynthetic peptidoglycan transglycosylase [Dysgonamonadaceae bacterium]MDD4605774.1 monofunctional biosynthetic peptidoglycan transglycosylase [Dysgonamonadaceae bacterium]
MFRILFRFIKKLIIFFFLSTIIVVIVLRFVPVYFTPLMGVRIIEQLRDKRNPRLLHTWIGYDEISDNLKRAVIASEDQLFFEHKGFDTKQIRKALEENKKRKRPRGASTISQQTAKNVFLWPQSSWLRKGLEAYFTVLIEFFWSKDRILHVYLNSMETGDGMYGADAVARHHFNTTAKKLSPSQAALIAATLPNPLRFSSKNPSAYIYKRQAFILQQMRNISLPGK